MKITEKHLAAVELLVESQFEGLTRAQQAEKAGVTRRTLHNWLADADFQVCLRSERSRWRRATDHIRFSHRRARLEELQRLLDETPDEREVMGVDKDGREYVVAYRDHRPARLKALAQMAEEVGGDVMEELAELKVLRGAVEKTAT